jgi:hypothetical protein
MEAAIRGFGQLYGTFFIFLSVALYQIALMERTFYATGDDENATSISAVLRALDLDEGKIFYSIMKPLQKL